MALIQQQTAIFLWAMVVGALIMALYDLFRILRLSFAGWDWLIFVEDLCFFVLAGLITWYYLLESCEGRIRGFVLVGEGIGALLYYLTIGQLVMAVAKPVIAFLRWTLQMLFRPVRWAGKKLLIPLKAVARLSLDRWKRVCMGFRKGIWENRKKVSQIGKRHLQEPGGILYNLFVTSVFAGKFAGASHHKQGVENGAESIITSDT